MQRQLLAVFFVAGAAIGALAQDNKDAVTFEELYDEPYAINKLFIGFQPLYAELFTSNVNAGFGIDAMFYYRDKADFHAHFRRPYSQAFFDFNRELASRNSDVTVSSRPFTYMEFGGTYHIKDAETPSKTKMTLYKSSYKGNKWASRVPLQTEVPAKLRTIYGVRAGAVSWRGTADLNQVGARQDKTNADLVNDSGEGLPLTITNPTTNTQEEFNAFTNIYCTAFYMGGSMGRFRNVAVSFDNYEQGVDDGMMTFFLDLMYAPILKSDPVSYNGVDYSTNAFKMSSIGVRAGLDGKFNRTLSWSYGGELGFRPSFAGTTFFAMFRIAFPVFGTNLENKVESFGK